MNKSNKSSKGNNSDKKKTSKSFFKSFGKIFLLAGIVFLQAIAAYAIVATYYPAIVKATSSPEPPRSTYYTLENIVVNPANTNGQRYLIMSMKIELTGLKALRLLKDKSAKVQDHANVIISKHSIEELSTINGRKDLKRELALMINQILNKNAVRNLFFTQYILQ